MIIDSNEQFSVAQPVRAVGDTISSRVVDTQTNYGYGGPTADRPVLRIRTAERVASGGPASLQIILQDAADGHEFSDLCECTEVLQAHNIPIKTLADLRLPPKARRFLRLVYRVAGAPLASGSFGAFLFKPVDDLRPSEQAPTQRFQHYPSGIDWPATFNRPGKNKGSKQ